ncbi:uncharacterized protein BX663DRAFT_585824, partial [Cokeromyces recurvatus]|uniref:uncharacterized protein n=1 Tax=Cokeromyces recurvatus TaxID=90255 RepID=UPI0022204966
RGFKFILLYSISTCSKLQEKHSKLLSHCRNNLIVDPILTIPMTRRERFRCVRWRLGWLPLGKPKPALSIQMNSSHTHAHIVFLVCICITAFRCPKSIEDPLSYLLNLLTSTSLTKKVRKSIDAWLIRWPSLCAIL